MDWDDIRLALAIARNGSLSRAALALDVNQSTVGRRLNALEAGLGVTLFLRSKHGLVLTGLGEVFVAKAAEIERQAEGLKEALSATDNKAAGVFRLAGNQWMINHLIRSGIGDLLEEYPSLEIRTIAGRPETSLWRGDPGVGLWFDTQPIDGAFQIKLGSIPYAAYKKKGLDIEAWVTFFDERNPGNLASSHLLRTSGENANLRLSALDAETLRAAIASGIGCGLLPICLADDDVQLERLSEIESVFERVLYCHIHPDTGGSVRVQTFLTWLRANFDSVFRKGERSVGSLRLVGQKK